MAKGRGGGGKGGVAGPLLLIKTEERKVQEGNIEGLSASVWGVNGLPRKKLYRGWGLGSRPLRGPKDSVPRVGKTTSVILRPKLGSET